MPLRRVDTPTLGPIRIALEPPISRQARKLLTKHIHRQGPGYANAADSDGAGNYGNIWTQAALAAIEEALREGPTE